MQYGRHRILKELGRGSMGVVYQAHDPQIDRLVALKVMRSDRITSENFVQRFLKEAKAIGRLSHPNMVTVYDIGEDQGTIYIAMEFVEGRPLHEIIAEKTFSTRDMIDLGIQVAEALDYAHRKGVVHRDIKPGNILVQPDGLMRITDFGIAHIENPDATQQTQAGEILGTPAYMSPEQVLGRMVDGRSDLFSLGVILYEMAAGERPFRGDNLATVFQGITNENPQPPIKANPAISRDLSRIIMKCLAKAPDDRFATGKDLSEGLRNCRQTAETSTFIGAPTPVLPKKRAFLMSLSLLIVVCLAGIGSLYFVIKNPFHHPPAEISMPRPEEGLRSPADKPPTEAPPASSEFAPHTTAPSPAGLLKVETTPAGAQVIIDGEVKGATPLDIQLPAGNHEVRLTLADHGDWAAQVKINDNKVTHIPIDLLPLSKQNP